MATPRSSPAPVFRTVPKSEAERPAERPRQEDREIGSAEVDADGALINLPTAGDIDADGALFISPATGSRYWE